MEIKCSVPNCQCEPIGALCKEHLKKFLENFMCDGSKYTQEKLILNLPQKIETNFNWYR